MPQLAPSPKFRAVGADGLPLVGGKVWTYAAGTSTPQNSYTDYGLGTANTNPVILDARGECDLWLSGNYKVVLTDSVDAVIWTVDNVRDVTASQTLTGMTLAGTLTVTSTAVTWSGNPTHSGNHTWTGNQVFNGNVTIGDASADALTVTPNAVTWSNNPTHSGNHTWSGTSTFAGAATFTAIPAGKVTSGTYTPTLTAAANCSAPTSNQAQYMRVGDVVTVSGTYSVTETSVATLCRLGISLPIASALTNAVQVAGVGSVETNSTNNHQGGTLAGDATNDRAELSWIAFGSGTVVNGTFTFTYLVV